MIACVDESPLTPSPPGRRRPCGRRARLDGLARDQQRRRRRAAGDATADPRRGARAAIPPECDRARP